MQKRIFFSILGVLCAFCAFAQTKSPADTMPYLTLDQCIVYALQNQPGVLQSDINIIIAKKTNEVNLSAWLPQVYFNANIEHYNNLPTAYTTNTDGASVAITTGVANTSTLELAATQAIFSPSLLYAARNAHLLVQQARQSNDSSKINIIAIVSSSFYNLLLTLQQINVLREDTARLTKNVKDTYHQYIGGIVDKTDYKEAIISLNNSKAQLRQSIENVKPLYATLKQTMGFAPEKNFNVIVDTAQMMREIVMDTAQQLQYKNRIEYQLWETSRNLQKQTIDYYRYDFLPTVSAFYTYNYEYENNSFPDLYNQAYPYSFFGATLSIPLFTGFGRLENLRKAKLQGQIIDLTGVNLKAIIYTQYESALASYKSNLYSFYLMKDNVSMARDVYNVVSLQYKQGIVAYLNVITAEDNLVSSETNYTNSLFQVLLSKVTLEKALGTIPPTH